MKFSAPTGSATRRHPVVGFHVVCPLDPTARAWRDIRGHTDTAQQRAADVYVALTQLGGSDCRHCRGYDFVHAAADDHSRLAYVEILPDERGMTSSAP